MLPSQSVINKHDHCQITRRGRPPPTEATPRLETYECCPSDSFAHPCLVHTRIVYCVPPLTHTCCWLFCCCSSSLLRTASFAARSCAALCPRWTPSTQPSRSRCLQRFRLFSRRTPKRSYATTQPTSPPSHESQSSTTQRRWRTSGWERRRRMPALGVHAVLPSGPRRLTRAVLHVCSAGVVLRSFQLLHCSGLWQSAHTPSLVHCSIGAISARQSPGTHFHPAVSLRCLVCVSDVQPFLDEQARLKTAEQKKREAANTADTATTTATVVQ